MTPPRIVTFLTDFGLEDSYVGQMKGAALAIHPDLQLVDLGHEVPPQDVAAGAYLLETAAGVFPDGTIHVAVVDPGVGTERRGLAVQTQRQFFVAPDNGLLSRVLVRQPILKAHVLEDSRYRRLDGSSTFDGRDIFAPAAAWIARGVPIEAFGPPAGELVRLGSQHAPLRPGIDGPVPVLRVDRFGNVILDVPLASLREALGADPDEQSLLVLETPRLVVDRFRRTYAAAAGMGPFLLVNSAGYLEVAVYRGSASEALGVRAGDIVRLRAGRAVL